MAVLKTVKFLAPAPGVPLAVLPVGLLAWDEHGNVHEEWAPDDERAAFWRGVVDRCREAGALNPDAIDAWAGIANGQTADIEVSDVPVPDGGSARETFGALAGEMTAEWAMMCAEIGDAADGKPSMIDLFRPAAG